MNKVVTIDGPSASGKSTVARRLAAQLGFLYVDSGSLYRVVAWQVLQEGLALSDESGVVGLTESMPIEFIVKDGAVRFRIGEMEPVDELRTVEVDSVVSVVAAMQGVRVKVVAWLRSMVGLGDLVIEGRDIGSAVFPQAMHKFYLDASPERRAGRRHAEIKARNGCVTIDETRTSLQKRDNIDATRQTDPLKIPDGAMVIDSTDMGIADVVGAIAASLPVDLKSA